MLDRYNITVERDTHNTLVQTHAYLQRQKHGQNTDNKKNEEQ
jgi:hypothetical protein